jgi:hypothetical protein
MAENDILEWCPVWEKPCIKSDCVSYEVHTKQRFKNIKTNQFVPIDQLAFYSSMTPEQLEETITRYVTIVHECKYFAKIIQIENKEDHLVPFEG